MRDSTAIEVYNRVYKIINDSRFFGYGYYLIDMYRYDREDGETTRPVADIVDDVVKDMAVNKQLYNAIHEDTESAFWDRNSVIIEQFTALTNMYGERKSGLRMEARFGQYIDNLVGRAVYGSGLSSNGFELLHFFQLLHPDNECKTVATKLLDKLKLVSSNQRAQQDIIENFVQIWMWIFNVRIEQIKQDIKIQEKVNASI